MKIRILFAFIFFGFFLSFSNVFSFETFAQEKELLIKKYDAVSLLSHHFDLAPSFFSFLEPKINFRDIHPDHAQYKQILLLCSYQVFTCEKDVFFDGESNISTATFLKMLYTLEWRGTSELQERVARYRGDTWYLPFIQEAVEQNILPENYNLDFLSFSVASEILRRHEILTYYDTLIPRYFDGLEFNAQEIRTDRYYDLSYIQSIIDDYGFALQAIDRKDAATKNHTAFERRSWFDVVSANFLGSSVFAFSSPTNEKRNHLISMQDSFQSLYDTVDQNPLLYDPTVPEDLKKLAQEFGVREKIGESFYDFSTNAAYRKYNIEKGLEKIQNRVLQPGEEFNFHDVVFDNNLRDFRMGWVILQGKEVWAVGGGLCGSATTLFEAAYRSGLEITERQAHSIFYRNLYPMEKIGLDAAVYGNRPNLKFKNNTGAPLVLHVKYPQPHVANLQIWGTKHVESVSLQGPNRQGNKTTWVRTLKYKDGTEVEDYLYSRFGSIQ